jgi:hypothetical protein
VLEPVHGSVEDVRVVVEDVLYTVAMVDVPEGVRRRGGRGGRRGTEERKERDRGERVARRRQVYQSTIQIFSASPLSRT